MKNFCGKCGSKLNPETGLCLRCSKDLQTVKNEKNIKKGKKKKKFVIVPLMLVLCCLCTIVGLVYFDVVNIPVVSDFVKRQNKEDSFSEKEYIEINALEQANQECIVIEEKNIEMENEKEGTATISVSMPNYEQLYKEALQAENPDEYLLNALNDVRPEISIDVVSEQDICNAMTEAATFAWDWFWDSSREVVDESDTYMELITEDYAQEYKRVSYEGIKNVEDVLELTKHYFTEEIVGYLMEQKLWHESGGILYMSEPDGIGSVEPDYLNIEIHKDSDTQYTITVYEYFFEELMTEPYEVHYKYVDGYWVFDEVLCMSSPIPIHVIQDADKVFNNGSKFEIVGTWLNEYYDSQNNWASSYQISFDADGTVYQVGYRNKDMGTYTISEDGRYITASFTENYLDAQGSWQLIEGYEYTVTYEIDDEEDCLNAVYSENFKELRYSNADDGKLVRDAQ